MKIWEDQRKGKKARKGKADSREYKACKPVKTVAVHHLILEKGEQGRVGVFVQLKKARKGVESQTKSRFGKVGSEGC